MHDFSKYVTTQEKNLGKIKRSKKDSSKICFETWVGSSKIVPYFKLHFRYHPQFHNHRSLPLQHRAEVQLDLWGSGLATEENPGRVNSRKPR